MEQIEGTHVLESEGVFCVVTCVDYSEVSTTEVGISSTEGNHRGKGWDRTGYNGMRWVDDSLCLCGVGYECTW